MPATIFSPGKNKPLLRLVCALFLLFQAPLSALPSFDEAMQTSQDYSLSFSKRNQKWRLLHSMYESYLQRPAAPSPLIPHLIHFIWLGSPLPERCKNFIASWQNIHPDWTVKIWTDQDVDAFQMFNKKAFQAATNYGEKSDIWRYEILDRFGGLYVDTDFECLKRFDEIHAKCTFYTGVAYDRKAVLFNGLIGAAPNHPIMKACIASILVGPGNNVPNQIMARTGPYFFTHQFFSMAEAYADTTVVFPVSYLYPFPGTERNRYKGKKIKQKWLKPESHALHYWSRSWVPQKKKKHKK